MGVKMREEWECPIDCKDRKIGCQNPNTCEVYRKAIERNAIITKSRNLDTMFKETTYDLKIRRDKNVR